MKKLKKLITILLSAQLLLVIFKITGVLDFPWWIILGPIMAIAAFVILTLLFTYLIAYVYGIW